MTDLTEAIKNIKSIDNLKTVIESYGINFKKDSTGYITNCPFHSEKTPSFRLKEKNNEAFYKCFGCNIQGDIINFIKEKEGFTTLEATKKAYEILGIKLDIQPSKLDKLKEYIEKNIKLDGYYIEEMYPYILDDNTPSFIKIKFRNINDKSKKDMRTYKIVDMGDYYRLGTKSKDGDYEYTIYNYPRVKEAINKMNNVYFVEGEKDAETLNKLGFTATTIFAKTNDEKIWSKYKMQLQNSKIVFIGDTGKAGKEFKQLVWEHLKDVIQTFKVVDLPGLKEMGDNKDVTDWLEVGHTKEELIEAIKDSWDWKVSTKWKDVTKITKQNGIVEIKPLNTIDNFKLILERTGTKIYKNEITKVLSVETNFFKNKTLDTLMTEIKSHCTKEHFKILKTDVRDYVEAIGNENSINLFKVWMDQLPSWDKTSRIDKYLENFITVDGYNKELKKLLMTKWLLSFCGSIYDPNYKAYGLLILKGEQGIGKGECFKRLVPIKEDWVFLGEQEYKGDRDNIQILTSHLIVEFSEFARSAKKVNEFKGFVTSEKDALSLKYDKYITNNKRNSIYFATVNDGEFLLDDNNRRMWIIDLESINWEGINNFDYVQLWAELKEIYLANPIVNGQPCYHLQNDEKDKLQESNKNYNFKSELGTVLESLLDFDNPQRLWVRSAEVLSMIDVKASGTSITRELKKLGEETSKDTPLKGIPRGRYNTCPLPRNWHGEIPKRFENRLKDQSNLKLVKTSKKSVETSTDKIIKELQNKNIELLTEKRNLLEKIEILEEKLQELLEINSWYEQNFNKKDV